MLRREQIAERIAADIPVGSYVNLGIGQPTLVANYLRPEQNIVLQTENGMLNMGPVASGADIDGDLTNADKLPVTELPGLPLPPCGLVCDDPRRASGCLHPGRFPGVDIWRLGELACW